MSGSATDYLESRVLQHFLRIAAIPPPAGLLVALCTTGSPPTDSAPGSEVAGGRGYVRQPAAFVMVASGVAANDAAIEFPAATAEWGTVGYQEIWDAAGNRLWHGPLIDRSTGEPITLTVPVGAFVRLPAGSLQVRAM